MFHVIVYGFQNKYLMYTYCIHNSITKYFWQYFAKAFPKAFRKSSIDLYFFQTFSQNKSIFVLPKFEICRILKLGNSSLKNSKFKLNCAKHQRKKHKCSRHCCPNSKLSISVSVSFDKAS